MATVVRQYEIKYIGNTYTVLSTNPKQAVRDLLKKQHGTSLKEVTIYETDERMANCVVINKKEKHHHEVFYYTIQFTTVN